MKRIVLIVLAAVFVVGLGAFLVVRSAEDMVTADMLSRAGRLSIPADWKMTDETVRPERFMCISTNPCPSLTRRWDTGKELTDDHVAAVFSGLGFEMKADGPCNRSSNIIGDSPICISRGADGEFEYLFTVFSPAPGAPERVVLAVEPVH
ncbi:hypothetical protein [Arthrobacter sp. SAFR-044]|uniref:hypothetical protein n=1 Tax=Arthrobacter sp. SAFR-044 TaxID=3387278 RepID=UPI003F7C3161